MNNQFNLNRISHPRASLRAFMLLVVAFGLFGIWANAHADISQQLLTTQAFMPELMGNICLGDVMSGISLSPQK